MEQNLKHNRVLVEIIESHEAKGLLPKKFHNILIGFFSTYEDAILARGLPLEDYIPVLEKFLLFIEREMKEPFIFQPYHEKITNPDYHNFGKDFLRPLIDFENSSLSGEENLEKAREYISNGENVVFLANHQIEADPQIIYLLLEKKFNDLGENMIFVAGDRVTTDPLAKPFSMGCNLFCIYSKKYIDTPPEKKSEKQTHNKKTMQLMSEKLSEGGKCIYVAPSGGRDRKGSSGKVEIAEFDPQSIEMFYLMAKRAKKPTHFFPLSLATFSILPPPEDIQIELGEQRQTSSGPVFLHFGNELDMVNFEGCDKENKINNRKSRAKYIHELVCEAYKKFPIDY